MNNLGKGIVAGIAGTVVLSVLMLGKEMMGVMPELNVIAMLAGMLGVSAAVAWVVHFAIGAVWGLLFAATYGIIPGGNAAIKGAIFSDAPWLGMMLFVMPMAGAGLFGMQLGIMAPIMTLVLHLIFGAVMGFVFAKLTSNRQLA